jgi:hypothetical protein
MWLTAWKRHYGVSEQPTRSAMAFSRQPIWAMMPIPRRPSVGKLLARIMAATGIPNAWKEQLAMREMIQEVGRPALSAVTQHAEPRHRGQRVNLLLVAVTAANCYNLLPDQRAYCQAIEHQDRE